MDYTQSSLFAHYKNSLDNKDCSDSERASIAQQLNSTLALFP